MIEHDITTMYNTKYVCQYNSHDVFLDTDDINEETKDQIRNILYRNDLLHIFDIDEFDEVIVNKVIQNLYEMLKQNTGFHSLLQKVSNKIIGISGSEYDYFGLLILYSFDYLHQSHICISELLETGNVSKTNLDILYALVG